MGEFNNIIERINIGQPTPSDEAFAFFMIFGLPAVVISIFYMIKLYRDGRKKN